MEYQDILWEKKDHVARVTINRPDRYNAAAPRTVHELIDAFSRCAMDADVGVVVFTGVGEKAFCTGAMREKASSGRWRWGGSTSRSSYVRWPSRSSRV